MPEGRTPPAQSELELPEWGFPALELSDLQRRLAPWAGHVARLLAPADGPVVVGCSGGTDSLALLALAAAARLQPTAVHVDHGLRDDPVAVADALGRAGARLGTPVCTRPAGVEAGANLEARARASRYAALEGARRHLGASCVLVGHTRDDQAETVLLNLLRGSATAGLGAMAERRGPIVRPLLRLSRSDTSEICVRLGFRPLEDPMNAQLRYRRVWLRREVIPFLEAAVGSDLRSLLARQADVLREESDLLDRLAVQAASELGSPPATGALSALPEALARRVVRRFLAGSASGRAADVGGAGGPGPPPAGLGAVDGVLEVARGARRAVDLPGGRRVVRSGGRLAIVDPPSCRSSNRDVSNRDVYNREVPNCDVSNRGSSGSEPGDPVRMALPGRAVGLGWCVESRLEREAPLVWPDGRFVCVLDAVAVSEVAVSEVAVSEAAVPAAPEGDQDGGRWVLLRRPLPGERFQTLGGGTKRIRRALAEGGVPAEARGAHPVLAAPGGEVIWVLGYRVAERFRVRPGTRRYLWVEATREKP